MTEKAVSQYVDSHERGSKVRGTVKEKDGEIVWVELADDVVGFLKKDELDDDLTSVDMIYDYLSVGDPFSAFMLGAEGEHVRLTKIESPSLFIGDTLSVKVDETIADGLMVELPSGSYSKLPFDELAWKENDIQKMIESISLGDQLKAIVTDAGRIPECSLKRLRLNNGLVPHFSDFEMPPFDLTDRDPDHRWRKRLFMSLREFGIDAPVESPSEGTPRVLVVVHDENGGIQFGTLTPTAFTDEEKELFDAVPKRIRASRSGGPDGEAFWDAIKLFAWLGLGEDANAIYDRWVQPFADRDDEAPDRGTFYRLTNFNRFERFDTEADNFLQPFAHPALHITITN